MQQNIKFELSSEPIITSVVLTKYDMTSFQKQLVSKLKAHKNSPIKLFINCKNARRKAVSDAVHHKTQLQNLQDSIDQSLMLDESVLNEDDKYTLKKLWEPDITREEIFFTGKENIEGFLSLLAYFLPQMVSREVDHPALINIDN